MKDLKNNVKKILQEALSKKSEENVIQEDFNLLSPQSSIIYENKSLQENPQRATPVLPAQHIGFFDKAIKEIDKAASLSSSSDNLPNKVSHEEELASAQVKPDLLKFQEEEQDDFFGGEKKDSDDDKPSFSPSLSQ